MLQFIPMFPAYLLIFVRVTSFFIMMPLFSYKTIPTTHKVGIGFFLSWIMYYTIEIPVLEINTAFYFLIIKEALVGIFIGFVAFVMLSAIQAAGGLIDFQMGFAIANVFDPQTGAQSPLTGQYLYTVALLFLLSVNGHHLLIDGVFHSYQFIPLDQAFLPFDDPKVSEYVIRSFAQMFLSAFQMSVPVVGSLFLVDVALGIVARSVPQLNIFVVGMPIKIVVSFILIIFLMGAMMSVTSYLIETMLQTMRNMMELLGGVR